MTYGQSHVLPQYDNDSSPLYPDDIHQASLYNDLTRSIDIRSKLGVLATHCISKIVVLLQRNGQRCISVA